MKSLLLFATGLILLAVEAAGQRSSSAPIVSPPVSLLVITNVNLVDVVAGEVLPNRMVVVRDGCITSIDTRAPGGRAVQRLDGRDKYLVPGLWDTHVQAPGTSQQERALLIQLVARGITSICYFSSLTARPALVATVKAVEAGAQVGPRIALATGGSNWAEPNPAHSSDLQVELNGLVASGCTPTEALQAATLLPAAAAGCRYTLGQIAPDFRADLLLLDANPLEDIRHLQQVRAVVLRGRVFDRIALEALLKELRAKPLSVKVPLAHKPVPRPGQELRFFLPQKCCTGSVRGSIATVLKQAASTFLICLTLLASVS
jgi:adenine deaminase